MSSSVRNSNFPYTLKLWNSRSGVGWYDDSHTRHTWSGFAELDLTTSLVYSSISGQLDVLFSYSIPARCRRQFLNWGQCVALNKCHCPTGFRGRSCQFREYTIKYWTNDVIICKRPAGDCLLRWMLYEIVYPTIWWRHSMDTFSAFLVICGGPVDFRRSDRNVDFCCWKLDQSNKKNSPVAND